MGLDTYLARISNMGEPLDWGDEVPSGLTAEDLAVFGALGLPLYEWGVYDDTVSFRGKIYNMVVMEVADHTLVQEWIPPAEVAEIAKAFEACDPEAVAASAQYRYEVTATEIRALRTAQSAASGWWGRTRLGLRRRPTRRAAPPSSSRRRRRRS